MEWNLFLQRKDVFLWCSMRVSGNRLKEQMKRLEVVVLMSFLRNFLRQRHQNIESALEKKKKSESTKGNRNETKKERVQT